MHLNVFYYVISLILISFIISVIKYNKYKKSVLKYFSILLGVTFITEITAHLFGVVFLIYNGVVYNIFCFFVNIFYFQFYKKLFISKKYKKLMDAFTILFALFYLSELIFLKKSIFKDFSHSIIIGAIFTVITIILYLIEIVKNDNIIGNIHKSLIFWISIGSLIFYVGIIPIFINSAFLTYREIYAVIIAILNVIMYSSFIIGYLVADPKFNLKNDNKN